MMKKVSLAVGSFILTLAVINPVIAAQSTVSIDKKTDARVTTSKKDGYTITSYSGGKEKNLPNKQIQPMKVHDFTLERGDADNFYEDSTKSYSDGELTTYSEVDVDYTDTGIRSDILTIDGETRGSWSGRDPYDADRITIQPAQTIKASGTSISLSIPPSASSNIEKGEATITWPSESDNDTWYLSYDWDEIEAETKGSSTFTHVIVNDISNFKFGSKITSVMNTLNVEID
jgi:hypothetical protein